MGKKKKAEEEEVYHVEVITRARVGEDGDWEYLVKWAGYDSDADSWEPGENVQQCNRLLASFWKHVGMDNEDYPVGYEVGASEDWINKEKRYFEDTFVKRSRRKSGAATSKDVQGKSKSNALLISDSSEDDNYSPDNEHSASARATTTKKSSRTTRVIDTDSESDDGSQRQTNARPAVTKVPLKERPKAPEPARQQENSIARSASPIIALPKVAAIRTHQEQRTNPLVKPMSLPSTNIEAGSTLSTKQRIAAGIPPPRPGPKPLPSAPKTSLSSLSFKKNKPPVPPSVQNKDVATSSTLIVAPASPVDQPTLIAKDAEVTASPQSMDVDLPMDFFAGMDDSGPMDANTEALADPIPSKSWDETNAEQFLKSIDLPALSAPLETTAASDQSNEVMVELGKTLAKPKIPKKWKWSGDLYINSEDKTELLCPVTIADPSGTSNTSHINLLLSSLDSLRLSKLYLFRDLFPLLRACGQPQYYGKLESTESSEDVAIQGLELHMTAEGLTAAVPLLLDGTEAAVLVIFPGAQKSLIPVLQVPAHLSEAPLIVVLLPFLVSSTQITGWKSIKSISEFMANQQDTLVSYEKSQPVMVNQAMILLGFPKKLLDFLQNSAASRTYCIWPSPDQSSLELDTAMLQYILKSTKAVQAKVEEDTRVIFISNMHLDSLHTMPTLAAKRANSPEVQFWTYGYSPRSTQEKWKLQEIYPLGGIVTFTSSALAEDLVGCYKLMSQIIEHPLWDCYVVPEALAVTHRLCNDGNFGSASETCLGSILDMISQGSIAVMRMPEEGYTSQLEWLSWLFHHPSAGEDELETCVEALKSHPTTSSMTTEELNTFTNNEITKDLLSAQIQPAFMGSYRRFVVIKAASEDGIASDKDGLEWLPLASFSFKDDYFNP